MAASQDDARGMDFWAALGIGEDSLDPQQGKPRTGKEATSTERAAPAEETPAQPASRPEQVAAPERPASAKQKQRAGRKAPARRTAPDQEATPREEQDDWAAMFSDEAAPPRQATAAIAPPPATARAAAPQAPKPAPPATVRPPARETPEQPVRREAPDPRAIPIKTPSSSEGSGSTRRHQAAKAAPKESPAASTAPTRPGASAQEPRTAPIPVLASQVRSGPYSHEETPAHVTYESQAPARAPRTVRRTDSGSPAHEGSAEYRPYPTGSPQRPRVPHEHAPATRLGTPLDGSAPSDGWRNFTELWRDDRVNEVHIRGTQVTVSGTLGVYSMPEFSSLGAARQAVEAIIATQAETGARIVRIGNSIVVTRRERLTPDTASLVAAGVLSEEQVSQVSKALQDMQAVTLTGPAAPVLMRSLASLVPAASRVFEGPYAVLPAGCVTVASPLDADYVIGVRPGALVEKMAAAGQIGALIANPETQFTAAAQFLVPGRSTAPGKVRAG